MRMPEAEVDITSGLVGRLIRLQHPDLLDRLTLVANGWDNVIFRLGDTRSVRLPRREIAAELINNEQRWLAHLARQLPVPVPVAERVGVPTREYPWYWSIGPWFEGEALTTIAVPERSRYAADLATFFAALHQPAPADAPVNPVRGIALSGRARMAEQHLGMLRLPDPVRTLWSQLVETPAMAGPPVWVHGDPHPANMLVTGGRLTAVIDFGDLCGGDPATDLAVGWLAFDAVGRQVFHDRYVAIRGEDPQLWRRARGWALSIGMSLLANSDDNQMLAAIGRQALDRVTQPEAPCTRSTSQPI